VIVPVEYEKDTIPILVKRSEKRAMLLRAIVADGELLSPFIIDPG
jgi:hypothetical protein